MKIALIIMGILLLLFILTKAGRRYSDKKNMAIVAGDKLREEALDKRILNQDVKKEEEAAASALPFEISYDSGRLEKKGERGLGKRKKAAKTMLQITETSELSARKYMLDPSRKIYIGSKIGENHIIVNCTDVDERQCEILESGGKVYVHNVGKSGKITLSRGGKRVFVEQKFIELKQGDILSLGNSIFKIDLVV